MPIKCTLVTPLKNERDNIESIWESILNQNLLPAEWIITDNGSTDGTYEWIISHAPSVPFSVRVLSLPGQTIAKMMNTAIASASFEIIACCHGGTKIPRDWLSNLSRPMKDDPEIDVTAGVWEPYGETGLEKLAAKIMYNDVNRIDENTFLPATRSVEFTRSAWQKIGGFPEWLPKFGEDTLFSIRLRASGLKFALARDANVAWRQKSSIRSLFKQDRLYSEANALMGLSTFDPRPYLRQTVYFGAVTAGFISGNPASGFLAFVLLLLVDFIRFHKMGPFNSFYAYLLSVWLIASARQLGYLRGILMRLFITVPEGDKRAILYYKLLVSSRKR